MIFRVRHMRRCAKINKFSSLACFLLLCNHYFIPLYIYYPHNDKLFAIYIRRNKVNRKYGISLILCNTWWIFYFHRVVVVFLPFFSNFIYHQRNDFKANHLYVRITTTTMMAFFLSHHKLFPIFLS